MRLGITINFEDTYEIDNISEDFKRFQFTTFTNDDPPQPIVLNVVIENQKNPFLPDVYNLGFGPLKEDLTIDDKAIIKHQDNSKVYSTLLLGALTFLNNNPQSFVGIDGSDITRAYLYYRLLQTNYDYLSQYFNLFGVKYYVRLLRGKEKTDPYMADNQDLATQPFRIKKGESIKCEKLYNYFIFNLLKP